MRSRHCRPLSVIFSLLFPPPVGRFPKVPRPVCVFLAAPLLVGVFASVVRFLRPSGRKLKRMRAAPLGFPVVPGPDLYC